MRRPSRILGVVCVLGAWGCGSPDYEIAVDLHADPPVVDFGEVDPYEALAEAPIGQAVVANVGSWNFRRYAPGGICVMRLNRRRKNAGSS